jgi:hypothetical protein
VKAWHAAAALIVAGLLLACSDVEPAPEPSPVVKICIEDGKKVECP